MVLSPWTEAWQTVDLTFQNPSGLPLSGIVDLFTYPDGGWIAPYSPDFFNTEGRLLLEVPAGGGMYIPGEDFQIIAYVEHDGGPTEWFPPQWFIEDVTITPVGGLEIIDVGGECTDTFVPPVLGEGEYQCFKVCHDIYHVQLLAMDTGTPNITVTPGCGPPTLCPDIPGCVAGGPNDYRYDV